MDFENKVPSKKLKLFYDNHMFGLFGKRAKVGLFLSNSSFGFFMFLLRWYLKIYATGNASLTPYQQILIYKCCIIMVLFNYKKQYCLHLFVLLAILFLLQIENKCSNVRHFLFMLVFEKFWKSCINCLIFYRMGLYITILDILAHQKKNFDTK